MWVKPEELTQTREPERWNNGLYWQWFELDGIEYRVGQHGWRDADDEEYTYIARVEPSSGVTARKAWGEDPFKYPRQFQGTIEPITAALIIRLMQSEFSRGRSIGYAQAQHDIRKALGVSG